MSRTNLAARRVKPTTTELVTARVLRRERLSPGFARVTLGGGDIDRFGYLGFDQWFRMFLPTSHATEDALTRLPSRLSTVAYLRYLAMTKSTRPTLRNYTVRGFRPEGPGGPELDVDFVLHGSVADGSAGPAATWAQTCAVGDPVALLDEGVAFNPDASLRRILLVADESGLAAVAGILGSVPDNQVGQAVIEVASSEDRQDFPIPPGVDVTWVVRDDATAVPGRAALATARALPLPDEPVYGWVVGEQHLVTSLRRHWVDAGVPKENIMFCGYWRAGRTH